MFRPAVCFALGTVLTVLVPQARAVSQAAETSIKAAKVLNEIMEIPEQSIPTGLLAKAHCVAIVPGMIKAGFIFAAKVGRGVISCRGEGGKGWTGPSHIKIEGGSFGLQIGGSATDVVLLVMNEAGKRKLLSSKFTLGGDARVAAGPVGRSAEAQTDAQMTAEILSYSRSKGVFAGISLEGATLRGNKEEDDKLYDRRTSREAILTGKLAAPEGVQPLMDALNKYSAQER